jgi:hypothetical protein
MINIDKMPQHQRSDFLEYVVEHFKHNTFFKSEMDGHRFLESNKIKLIWHSGNGCEYTITSKSTGLTFSLHRVPFITDPSEKEFADGISALYNRGSDWTAMKYNQFNKEFFGWKD